MMHKLVERAGLTLPAAFDLPLCYLLLNAYRREGVNPSLDDRAASPIETPAALRPTSKDDTDPLLSHIQLGEHFGIVGHLAQEALRKRLTTWRKSNAAGWEEIVNRRKNKATFFYQLSAVRHLCENRPSGGSSGKRPAK